MTRVDLRLKYQDNPGGFEDAVLTARADKPFVLGGGWKLSTRIDVPIVNSNVATPDNLAGDADVGLGDVLLQALFITPAHGKAAFAFGSQLIIPTGSDDQFTTGKWQVVPTAAAVYQLPEISRGTFVALLVRDAFSFAGKDDRAGINNFSIQPIFNWQLPQQWFLNRDLNVDVDVHHEYGYGYHWDDHYHPVARAAVVTAAAVTTAAVIGSMVRSIPPSCVTVIRVGISYYQCGTVWYQPTYVGTAVQYVVVTAP